jgi:hypothetical protein
VSSPQYDPEKNMQEHAPQSGRSIRCEDVESLAVLYACDELDAAGRADLEAHAAACSQCAAVVAREVRLQQAVVSLEQPAESLDRSGLLLARCRSELAEALDDRQASTGRPAWLQIFSPAACWGAVRHALIYHPALSMMLLLIVGFLGGVARQELSVGTPVLVTTPPAAPLAAVSRPAPSPVPPKITDEQLRSAASAHVAWVTPAGGAHPPAVQVQLDSPTPMDFVGAPDDADVQRALRFFLENGQQFDPDVRLDSLDVLRTNAADPDVRRTLSAAAHLDRNPDVRRKALDAMQGFESDPVVRDAFLDALESDADSGVRAEAAHLILSAVQSESRAFSADPQTIEVLRDRLHNDPSPAVRRHSAEALRALGDTTR